MDTLKKQITEYCSSNQISGVLRVTRKEQILFQWSFGYADWKNHIPFTEDSMFTLYSLSKPFCALGLLRLKDDGLVDLDAHPGRYVPEATAFDSGVTVRQLLLHTSGIPDFEQTTGFAQRYAPGYAGKLREHLQFLSAYPSYFPAGTSGKYANVNYALAALIIENVSTLPYCKFMHQEIFTPLGMKHAVVDNETLYIPSRVKGYDLAHGVFTETPKSFDWMFGAGDLVATVDDVYALNQAYKHRLLLTDETWDEALQPSPINQKAMFGCTVSNWHGKYRITHNGGHTGFRTLHIQLPEDDFDIILLSNSGFGEARNDISELIHSAFYGNSSNTAAIEMDAGYI